MGRKPSSKLYNTTLVVKRPSETKSSKFERNDALVTIATVLGRIDINRWFGVAKVKDQGFQSTSSHRGFTATSDSFVIKDGDHIESGGADYRVNTSDPAPGGVQDSHYELWMSKVK